MARMRVISDWTHAVFTCVSSVAVADGEAETGPRTGVGGAAQGGGGGGEARRVPCPEPAYLPLHTIISTASGVLLTLGMCFFTAAQGQGCGGGRRRRVGVAGHARRGVRAAGVDGGRGRGGRPPEAAAGPGAGPEAGQARRGEEDRPRLPPPFACLDSPFAALIRSSHLPCFFLLFSFRTYSAGASASMAAPRHDPYPSNTHKGLWAAQESRCAFMFLHHRAALFDTPRCR